MIDVSVIFVLISYNLFELDKERNRKIFFKSTLTVKIRFQKNLQLLITQKLKERENPKI